MSSNDSEFLVLREDVDPALPVAVGDIVTSYEIPGNVRSYYELPAHTGHTPDLFKYEEDVVQHQNEDANWSVSKVLRCTCRRQVAQVLFHLPSERLWVVITAPEWVPAARRRGDAPADPIGQSLHGSKGEAPCDPVAVSCPGCDARWFVLLFADRAQLVPVGVATHRRTVTE